VRRRRTKPPKFRFCTDAVGDKLYAPLFEQWDTLTPLQQRTIKSADAARVIFPKNRVPHGVYRSLVIRGLIQPIRDYYVVAQDWSRL